MRIEYAKRIFDQQTRLMQDEITTRIRDLDPEVHFTEDRWHRKDVLGNDGGGGITRHFAGQLFESGGVNTSKVYGQMQPDFAEQLGSKDAEFWAAGMSLILHPVNPRIPTVHANFRMIQLGEDYWFGGGADLTPYYPHEEDFVHFHQSWATTCEPYQCYEWMKRECDQYFVNHHRDGEMRGIGGLFFDRYKGLELEADLLMMNLISKNFINSYFPIVEKRINEPYDPADVEFQLHRRGRYVEFNLLHDRGTLFGLKTGGRIDSILISLPPRVKFTYCYKPPENSAHARMQSYYKPMDWLNFKKLTF